MPFLHSRCPDCGKTVSKNADFCNTCGCPSATGWAACTRCGSSVGADSQFCWKCGEPQDLEARRRIYFDRWQRSPGDFAIRIDLVVPDKTLHHGLQVEHGTMALIFRNGAFHGILEPGYHEFDSFIERLFGTDASGTSHAILLDARSAEIDFYLDRITTTDGIAIDVRVRTLFQVTDPRRFGDRFLTGRTTFTQQDLSDAFHADVRAAVQGALGQQSLDGLLAAPDIRELIEEAVKTRLAGAFAGAGLKTDGVRLADLTGEAVETLREKMTEFRRRTLERDLDRRLQDSLRAEKVDLFRDEHDLNAEFERIAHTLGLESVEREKQRQAFLLSAEKELKRAGLQLDWSIRLEHVESELKEARVRRAAELEGRRDYVGAELEENERRAALKQAQEKAQAATDLEVARQGIEALKAVKAAKHEARARESQLDIEIERQLLDLRGGAQMQALLATLSGEQADRLLKLSEMQMRQGMTAEQSMAFIAEKAPDYFAPAVAEALRAKFGQESRSAADDDDA